MASAPYVAVVWVYCEILEQLPDGNWRAVRRTERLVTTIEGWSEIAIRLVSDDYLDSIKQRLEEK